MTSPAFLTGEPLLWSAVLLGLAFGFLLHRGGVTDPDVIVRFFRLRDFTVVKVMMTALTVGGVGVLLLRETGLATLQIKELNLLAVCVGAGLFGIGMAVCGSCPGTGLAAAATGRLDAMAALAGMMAGGIAYALAFPWLAAEVIPVGAFGKVRLPDLLGLPEWACYLGLVAMTAGVFTLIAKAEKKA